MWISFRFASLYCPAILPPQCLLYYQNSRSTVVADHDTKTMSATNNNDGNDVGTNEIDHGNKIPLVLLRHMLNEKVCRPKNNSLPASISMVGLGCSSFSSFFWTPDDDTNDSSSSNNQLRISCNECGEESIDRANPNVQEWIETIVYAIQCAGITLLDTAPWYGHGTSEIVIGYAMDELLSKRNDDTTAGYDPSFCRHDITINTKIGRYESDPRRQFDFSYETTISSAVRSIKRMKCQYINVLQLHDPEFAPSLDIIMNETIPAMLHCQKHGFCKGLGMTGM